MKEEAVVKPKVYFTEFGYWDVWEKGRGAVLFGILNHPRLGREHTVYTSTVLSVDNEESPKVIETRNTIYVLKEKEDEGKACNCSCG